MNARVASSDIRNRFLHFTGTERHNSSKYRIHVNIFLFVILSFLEALVQRSELPTTFVSLELIKVYTADVFVKCKLLVLSGTGAAICRCVFER
jgi:hypothetical protein